MHVICVPASMATESLVVPTGIMYALGFGFGLGPLMRWRVREERRLRGNMLSDVVVHYCLPCCALIQENKQLYGLHGSHVGEKIPIKQEVERK